MHWLYAIRIFLYFRFFVILATTQFYRTGHSSYILNIHCRLHVSRVDFIYCMINSFSGENRRKYFILFVSKIQDYLHSSYLIAALITEFTQQELCQDIISFDVTQYLHLECSCLRYLSKLYWLPFPHVVRLFQRLGISAEMEVDCKYKRYNFDFWLYMRIWTETPHPGTLHKARYPSQKSSGRMLHT